MSVRNTLLLLLFCWMAPFSWAQQAPVALPDTFYLLKGQRDTVDVGANDTDPQGDAFSVNIIGWPKHGNYPVTLNCDFSFAQEIGAHGIDYNPCISYCGRDSIGYRACDVFNNCPPNTDTTWVQFYVCAIPDPKTDSITAMEDDVNIILHVQANDIDLDSDSLTTTIFQMPNFGSATVVGDTSISYTPNPNFFGRDTVWYQVCDTDGLCDVDLAIFIITPVPDTPIAVNDTVTTAEDTPILIMVQNNDSDPDMETLFTFINSGSGVNGSASVIAQTNINYLPDLNYNGTDVVYYRVCDQTNPTPLCDSATVVITITPVPDPPGARDDTVNMLEDGGPVVIHQNDNDTNPDMATLTAAVVIDAVHGTTNVLNNDSIQYTPDLNYFGPDSITYEVCNAGLCDTAIIRLFMDTVNDAPVAVNDTLTGLGVARVVVQVQANDSDVENDPVMTTIIDPAQNGTLNVLDFDSVEYIPGTNFFTADSFSYSICDGGMLCDTAWVFMDFSAVPNTAPIAVDDTTSVLTGVMDFPIHVQQNDNDPDGDSLTTRIIVSPVNGTAMTDGDTSILYTPTTDFTGMDSLVYEICDDDLNPLCDSAMVYIDVQAGIMIPSGFSPNGDDVNDVFYVSNLDQYPSTQLQVFNRYGSKVYESDDYQNDWAGTNQNGDDLPDGTYFFVLKLSLAIRHSGHITIHR